MSKEYFELDLQEKKQERIILGLTIFSFLIIAKGIYNQYYKIDQDNILIPLLLIVYSCLFFVYGINALTKGNITSKWTPTFLYQPIFFLIKKIDAQTNDKAKYFCTKLLGSIALIISLGFFAATIALLFIKK